MSWYQNKVRNYSKLGEVIGKWLVQGVNGLDQSAFATMTNDLNGLIDPLSDYSYACSEGADLATRQQGQQLTWQQQELLQRIMTLKDEMPQQSNVLENTGGMSDV